MRGCATLCDENAGKDKVVVNHRTLKETRERNGAVQLLMQRQFSEDQVVTSESRLSVCPHVVRSLRLLTTT